MKYTIQAKKETTTFNYGEGKTGKKIQVILQDENQELDTGKLTLFDGQAEPNEGDTVEMEKEVTEKWGTKFTIKQSNTQKKGWTGKGDPAKAASIERQVALKEAVNLAVYDRIKVEQVLQIADKFDAWLKHRPEQPKVEKEPEQVKQNPPIDNMIPDLPIEPNF